VIAIDITSADRVDRSHLSGPAAPWNRLDTRFAAGVAFHLERARHQTGDRLFVPPVDRLRTSHSPAQESIGLMTTPTPTPQAERRARHHDVTRHHLAPGSSDSEAPARLDAVSTRVRG